MAKCIPAIVVGALIAVSFGPQSADSFTNGGMKARASVRNRGKMLFMVELPSAEKSAKALSDYMAKSHEEKLRAVREVEQKKEEEIGALKKELADLKAKGEGSGQIVQAAVLPEGSKEEILAKLQSYQKFMADYIIKAQEAKLAAVRAAEVATSKKYEEKLLLLGGATPPPAPAPAALPPAAAAAAPKLFTDRNAHVVAAAKAGKSRWGDEEVAKAGVVSVSAAAAPPAPAKPPPPAAYPASTPPEVVAADHGLSADGGVGGPSLAERIAQGTSISFADLVTVASSPIYDKRNAMVAAAGVAGKSRWGDAEIGRATELAGNAIASGADVIAEVEAADHGLRADGGVGGPSLSERVNLGALLLNKQ